MNEVELDRLERFSFGDSSSLAESLLALVLSGEKTATCWDAALGPQTEVGKLMVACDGLGRPRAVLRTEVMVLRRFCDVSDEFARKEGEGDLTLGWWRKAHEGYFRRNGHFNAEMMLWCEEFSLVGRVVD